MPKTNPYGPKNQGLLLLLTQSKIVDSPTIPPRSISEGFRLFSLPNIEGIEVLDEYFERDPEFSLQEFSQQSFEVFQEEPFEVVWRFSPKAAADAADFSFHPNQETEKQSDGSLIVRFKSGGALEMCWHLYCWGEDVEVLAPAHLAAMCATHREEWPGLP